MIIKNHVRIAAKLSPINIGTLVTAQINVGLKTGNNGLEKPLIKNLKRNKLMMDYEIIERLTNLQSDILGKLDKGENDIKNATALDCAISIIKQTTIQL